jgi:hypothetical protein
MVKRMMSCAPALLNCQGNVGGVGERAGDSGDDGGIGLLFLSEQTHRGAAAGEAGSTKRGQRSQHPHHQQTWLPCDTTPQPREGQQKDREGHGGPGAVVLQHRNGRGGSDRKRNRRSARACRNRCRRQGSECAVRQAGDREVNRSRKGRCSYRRHGQAVGRNAAR